MEQANEQTTKKFVRFKEIEETKTQEEMESEMRIGSCY